MVRGRKPDLTRRQEAARLRRQGLSVGEIARWLGVSKQGAHHLLDKVAGDRPIACRDCGAVIIDAGFRMDNIVRRPLCLACLANHPDADFGERLRALRLAKGMTHAELAQAVGIAKESVSRFECGRSGNPKWKLLVKLVRLLVKLVRLLGPALVGWHG
jgi:DNA-binding XRE family transcriptional regulator